MSDISGLYLSKICANLASYRCEICKPYFSLILVNLSLVVYSAAYSVMPRCSRLLFLRCFECVLNSDGEVFNMASNLFGLDFVICCLQPGEIGGSLRGYFVLGLSLSLWMASRLGTIYFKSSESIRFFLMYSRIKPTNTS